MKPETKIKKWYKDIEMVIQMEDRDMAYEKKLAAIQNLPYDPPYFDLFRYAELKLIMNDIETAKSFFRQGVDILVKKLQSAEGLPPGILTRYDIPFQAYFGGGQEKLCQFGSIILSNLEKQNAQIESWHSPSDILQKYSDRLVLSYCIKEKGKAGEYLQKIEERIDINKFGNDGFPVSKGRASLGPGHAMYYKELIKALIHSDTDQFVEYFNKESAFGFRFSKVNEPEMLLDKPLAVLYDLALREGMRPKVVTYLVPKVVLEHGYWSQI